MKRPWVWQILIPLAGVALVIGGILGVGQWTRDWLKEQPSSRIPLGEIDCPAPPGQAREAFLGEVQFLANLPEQVSLLDEGLGARLTEAFGRHHWVEKVDGVQIRTPGQVQVRLTFRTPVLAVTHEGQTRVVDGRGIVLPPSALAAGLMKFTPPPTAGKPGASGTVWDDAAVVAAARIAALLRPHQESLRLAAIEGDGTEFVLTGPSNIRLLWGHGLGGEKDGEPSGEDKLKRLLDLARRPGGISPREHDLRIPRPGG